VAFGAGKDYKGYQVKTKDDMIKLFENKEFASAPCLQLVELYMPREDAPSALKLTAEAAASRNK
jgi:pyruvate decarboxylase